MIYCISSVDAYVGDDNTDTACILTASFPDTYELTHGLEECGMTASYDGTEGTISFSVS